MYARAHGFGLALLRLGIVYGPSPVEHDAPESQTVVDKFRRLAAAGEQLTLDGGGRATIGVVHVDGRGAASLLDCPAGPAGHGRQRRRRDGDRRRRRGAGRAASEPPGGAAWTASHRRCEYEHSVAEYLAR